MSPWRRRRYPKWLRMSNEDIPEETALDILDKRYARGEIDEEEYKEKKAIITSSNS